MEEIQELVSNLSLESQFLIYRKEEDREIGEALMLADLVRESQKELLRLINFSTKSF